MKFIRKFLSKIPMLKTGIGAGVFTVIICLVCFGIYNVRAASEKKLEEQGEALFNQALPDDYYRKMQMRFVNENGETYDHYKLMEGVAVSFYGDGGILDETEGYTLPGMISLNFLERFVYIMGNEGETPESIAAKQGGVPMYAQPFTIPAGQESVQVTLINEYGTILVPELKNNGGLNPCIIAGVEGNISVDDDGNTYFTRLEDGKAVTTEKDTVVTSRAMKNRQSDITVVFLKELPEGYSAERYVEVLKKMRDYQNLAAGGNCFYVISPIINTDSEKAAELDSLLEENFGSYYINAREYLCGEAIEKYNIRVWSEDDVAAVKKGQVCSSFLTRNNKLNIYGIYALTDIFTETINKNDSELLELRYEHVEE